MSEYLTYTLWQQREQRMPHELEHQRFVQERLRQQEQALQLEQESTVSSEPQVAEAPAFVETSSGDEYVLVDE